jgi:hypothetical protein
MADETLLAKRINNEQSEIWFAAQPESKRIVATNGVLYPVRTSCSKEETEAFQQALNEGTATVPAVLTARMMTDFGLSSPR